MFSCSTAAGVARDGEQGTVADGQDDDMARAATGDHLAERPDAEGRRSHMPVLAIEG